MFLSTKFFKPKHTIRHPTDTVSKMEREKKNFKLYIKVKALFYYSKLMHTIIKS